MTQLKLQQDRIESIVKNMKSQTDNTENSYKIFTKTMIDGLEKIMRNEFEMSDKKLGNVRLENHRYAVELKELSGDMNSKKAEVLAIKNEVEALLLINEKKVTENSKQVFTKLDTILGEYEVLKTKFNELSEFFKVDNILRRMSGLKEIWQNIQ